MLRQIKRPSFFICGLLIAGSAGPVRAQNSPSPQTTVRSQSESGLGLDLFGAAGVSWPGPKDSFEAVELRANPIDIGGGARFTGLWGGVFLQVSGSHWSDTGTRVFIASDGTTFPLGIPLDVKATFIDGTVGVKRALSNGRSPYFGYLGGGAGVVRYSERSAGADAGEDLELTKLSYHGAAGLEFPILQRLAAVVDVKYRYIPDLLGEGGASAVLGEDSFGGFNATVGLRVSIGGKAPATRPPTAEGSSKPPISGAPVPQGGVRAGPVSDGVFIAAGAVYLLPDATRTPLTILAEGTTFRAHEQKGDWVRIEFRDPQYGPRYGWVLKRFVKLAAK